MAQRALMIAAAMALAGDPKLQIAAQERAMRDDAPCLDLTSEQWQAKFIFLDKWGKMSGAQSLAARAYPSVKLTTLRSRYDRRDSGPKKMGPPPRLDEPIEKLLVDFIMYVHEKGFPVTNNKLTPHTTHLLCALDCGIFRSFKAHLNTAVHNLGHVATIDDVSGLIKEAWGKAMTITKNPLTGAEDSVAIRAFKKVGLAPFNRDVLSDKEYGYTDLYKSEHAEDGPNKKPRLSLSVEELQKRRADILSDYKKLPEDVVAAAKRAPRTGMAEIYTYSGTIIKEAEKSEVKEEEAKRKANYPWVLAGVSRKIWIKTKKDEKDKKAQEEKAAKAAEKLKKAEEALALAAELAKKKADAAQAIAKVAAAPPLPKPVPKAMPAPAKVAAPVAQRQIGKRGIKRPRPHDEM